MLDKVVLKKTGQIGYFVKESRVGEILIRIPRSDGWPFPDYVIVKRKDIKRYREDDLKDVPLAPF